MEKEIICISCPIGCHLKVMWDKSDSPIIDEIKVENNKCSRGEIYGKEEILAPKRVITATCAIESIEMQRIPVKTSGAILKELTSELLEEIYRLKIKTPVQSGDILLKNFKQTGIDILATRSLSK